MGSNKVFKLSLSSWFKVKPLTPRQREDFIKLLDRANKKEREALLHNITILLKGMDNRKLRVIEKFLEGFIGFSKGKK